MLRPCDRRGRRSKRREEINRSCGYAGLWKTTAAEVGVEQTTVVKSTSPVAEGPLLLGLKDAANAMGLSSGTLHQLVNEGAIDHVPLGSGNYVSRQHLVEFIKAQTRKGNDRAR
jgi:hypothetical protein